MSAARIGVATCAACAVASAWADGPAPDVQPGWEFALTAYPTVAQGADNNYTSVIGTADRGALHLEARYSYEAVGARSAFVGWNFSGGDALTWEVTPLLGGVWGPLQAFVPGVELSLGYGRFDFYLEGEYVDDGDAPYTYAWSELGFAAQDWLRIGLAAQRTRIFGEEREIQRGPFAQASWDRFTVGGYWFNPGADDQILVGSIGVTF
jgi:hypothetical protein